LKQRLPILNLTARGSYDGSFGRFEMEELFVNLGNEGRFILPSPTNHEMPVTSIRARGRFLNNETSLDITAMELDVDLGGPTASLNLTARGLGATMTLDATGVLRKIPVDGIEKYWPQTWGTSAHAWVKSNLSHGTVTESRASISLKSDGNGGVQVLSVTGDMDLKDFSVDYISPMPKVIKVSGRAVFNQKKFDIHITHGKTKEGLIIRQGSILFSGLDQFDQYADIKLLIDGSVDKTLSLIDSKPLQFASILGLTPEKTNGRVVTRLGLRFIVEHALSRDQVKVSASADMSDVMVRDAAFGLDVNQADLHLEANNAGMDLTGNLKIGTIPGRIAWRENFTNHSPVRRRYSIEGLVSHEQRTKELGLSQPPFSADFMKGDTPLALQYTVFNDGRRRLEAEIDLRKTTLRLQKLDWRKEPGTEGRATTVLEFNRNQLEKISRFSIEAGDLKAHGSAEFDTKTERLKTVTIERLQYPGTDTKVTIVPREGGGWDADLIGSSFNFISLYEDLTASTGEEPAEDVAGAPFSLSFNLDRVLLGPSQTLHQVAGAIVNDGRVWTNMQLHGAFEGDKWFFLNLLPQSGGKRDLTITAQDAGEVLRVFDFYPDVVGGTFEVNGTYDGYDPSSRLTGNMVIKDFRVKNAPTLAQIASVMSLTGIIDALTGEGLAFSELSLPFTLKEGVLGVKDARAGGLSLGLTGNGEVYLNSNVIRLHGTVAPAYVINNVLGDLFLSPEKGGGLFAANYTVSGPREDPDVSVNLLSVLTPGFLRNLFGLFDNKSDNPSFPQQ